MEEKRQGCGCDLKGGGVVKLMRKETEIKPIDGEIVDRTVGYYYDSATVMNGPHMLLEGSTPVT